MRARTDAARASPRHDDGWNPHAGRVHGPIPDPGPRPTRQRSGHLNDATHMSGMTARLPRQHGDTGTADHSRTAEPASAETASTAPVAGDSRRPHAPDEVDKVLERTVTARSLPLAMHDPVALDRVAEIVRAARRDDTAAGTATDARDVGAA